MDLKEYIDQAVKANFIVAEIVKRTYEALEAAGTPVVSVWDGEETHPVSSLEEVYTQVFNLDEAHLNTNSGGWVFLVMGQDWDTLTDYTVSLEDALKPINDWIMQNMR